jgi:hypothetical protein
VKKLLLIFVLLFQTILFFAQSTIQGFIYDQKTKMPLAFCNILIKGTTKGSISNTDGAFEISLDIKKDTLIFFYLGYHSKSIPAFRFEKDKNIYLGKKSIELAEFSIYSSDDYLYEILHKCRKTLLKNHIPYETKAYYGIETKANNHPLELLECYYNAALSGIKINELKFKNGRVALATVDGNFFETYNTAKAVSMLSLVNWTNYYPDIPLQFNLKKMRKLFILKEYASDSSLFHIQFTPRKEDKKSFSGSIWIERASYKIRRIDFEITHAKRHPFLPMHSTDSIYDVNMDVSQIYQVQGAENKLDHISFNYSFNYHSVRDTNMGISQEESRVITRKIASNGIVRLYDYDNPFIIPYFEYPNDLYYGDYYKMSFIPYNQKFWANNNSMVLTAEQKKSLGFFAEKGKLINYFYNKEGQSYSPRRNGKQGGHFQFQYVFWSAQKRIIIKDDLLQNKVYSQNTINGSVQRDLYNIKVQILLDITKIGDSLFIRSYSVFDTYKSFYHLPKQDYTHAFLNIYFDICEIERRKMEQILAYKNYSIQEIDSIYQITLLDMDKVCNRYIKEVGRGLKWDNFKKWNQYVIDELGIDNIKLIEETLKHKEGRE